MHHSASLYKEKSICHEAILKYSFRTEVQPGSHRSADLWLFASSPDLSPLWLLVGTPSAIRLELAFSRAEHSLPYSDVTIYIFSILYLSSMLYVYRVLWPLRLVWLLVWCLYKEVYLQIFKRVSFWLHGCCGEWEGWARKPGSPHQ